jgi:hypothetical protein
MKQIGPTYIGKSISIAALRNYILDLGITAHDTLLLNASDFDDIVLEYREAYGAPMPDPYFILGVLIDEGVKIKVPLNRVIVLQDDDQSEHIKTGGTGD